MIGFGAGEAERRLVRVVSAETGVPAAEVWEAVCRYWRCASLWLASRDLWRGCVACCGPTVPRFRRAVFRARGFGEFRASWGKYRSSLAWEGRRPVRPVWVLGVHNAVVERARVGGGDEVKKVEYKKEE